MPLSDFGCLTPEELSRVGLAGFGDDLRIHRTVLFFGAARIRLGSHVRIDAYSVLSAGRGGIRLGSHVHLAVGVTILGDDAVDIDDFCGLSAKVSVFSSSDDYSGGALTNPTVPAELRNVASAPVRLEKHAIIGASSVIMPGVTIGVGAAVGAVSFVNKDVPAFAVVSGNPVRKIGTRDHSLLDREGAVPAGGEKGASDGAQAAAHSVHCRHD